MIHHYRRFPYLLIIPGGGARGFPYCGVTKVARVQDMCLQAPRALHHDHPVWPMGPSTMLKEGFRLPGGLSNWHLSPFNIIKSLMGAQFESVVSSKACRKIISSWPSTGTRKHTSELESVLSV